MDRERIALRELLSQDPADIAETLGELSEEQAAELLHRLYLGGAAASTLAEMDPEESADLVRKLDRQVASTILSRMDPDDAVDLLEELPEDVRKELLSRLSRLDAKRLTELLAYPPDSAGGLMTPEVVALSLSMTAQDAIDVLRQRQEKAGTIYYAYAVDDANHLQGVLSLRDIALARPDRSLGELVIRDAVSVRVDQDVEDVAKLFDKYDFFALPVVDGENRLLGVITVDDVIDVIRDEATEDIYHLASVPSAEGVDTSWWDSLRLRLPWLYAKLLTGLAAALVVGLLRTDDRQGRGARGRDGRDRWSGRGLGDADSDDHHPRNGARRDRPEKRLPASRQGDAPRTRQRASSRRHGRPDHVRLEG